MVLFVQQVNNSDNIARNFDTLVVFLHSFAKFSWSNTAHMGQSHARGSNPLCTPHSSVLYLPLSLTSASQSIFSHIFPFFPHTNTEHKKPQNPQTHFSLLCFPLFALLSYFLSRVQHSHITASQHTEATVKIHVTTLHHFDNLSIGAASLFPSLLSLTESFKTQALRRLCMCVGGWVG